MTSNSAKKIKIVLVAATLATSIAAGAGEVIRVYPGSYQTQYYPSAGSPPVSIGEVGVMTSTGATLVITPDLPPPSLDGHIHTDAWCSEIRKSLQSSAYDVTSGWDDGNLMSLTEAALVSPLKTYHETSDASGNILGQADLNGHTETNYDLINLQWNYFAQAAIHPLDLLSYRIELCKENGPAKIERRAALLAGALIEQSNMAKFFTPAAKRFTGLQNAQNAAAQIVSEALALTTYAKQTSEQRGCTNKDRTVKGPCAYYANLYNVAETLKTGTINFLSPVEAPAGKYNTLLGVMNQSSVVQYYANPAYQMGYKVALSSEALTHMERLKSLVAVISMFKSEIEQ